MKMKVLAIGSLAVLVPLALWGMRTRALRSPLEVVPRVDLTRYMGTWYEVARFPHRFEEGCVAAKATYTLREDGTVDVLNECRLDRFEWTHEGGQGHRQGGQQGHKREAEGYLLLALLWGLPDYRPWRGLRLRGRRSPGEELPVDSRVSPS